MKDDRLYLTHIADCIAKIESYTEGGKQTFLDTPIIQDAVLRNLEIIGEATKNVSDEFRRAHSEVGWRRAIMLRNVLIHNYPGVSIARVWADVTTVLPKLKAQIAALLADFEPDRETGP